MIWLRSDLGSRVGHCSDFCPASGGFSAGSALGTGRGIDGRLLATARWLLLPVLVHVDSGRHVLPATPRCRSRELAFGRHGMFIVRKPILRHVEPYTCSFWITLREAPSLTRITSPYTASGLRRGCLKEVLEELVDVRFMSIKVEWL